MTALKIGAIVGSLVIAAGGSAAVATRDKWLPETTTSGQEDEDRPAGSSNNLPRQDNGRAQTEAGTTTTSDGASGQKRD